MSLEPLHAALAGWSPRAGTSADPLHAIAAAWPAIVGADVAAHCAPLELSNGVLVIATPSSAWSQQLQFLSLPIVAGVNELGAGPPVVRLAFRAGAYRRPARTRPAPRVAASGRAVAAAPVGPEPARDLDEAFARVRRRIAAVRRAAAATCATCGAPQPAGADAVCAPCRQLAERSRRLELERLLYLAPWLDAAAVGDQVPGVTPGDFERARRHLLQRWWLVLERARRAKTVGRAGLERQIASSYVLLHSRIPPDRITPAIVRNLLGEELEALLWPGSP